MSVSHLLKKACAACAWLTVLNVATAALYDAATDFLASPGQSNTVADTWQYYRASRGPGVLNGATFTLLPNFDATWNNAAGLQGWQNGAAEASFAVVARNTSGSALDPWGTLEDDIAPTALFLHPAPSQGYAEPAGTIAWLAPAAGTVDLNLDVLDCDDSRVPGPANGASDGVSWFLDLGVPGALTNLAAGVVDADQNGGQTKRDTVTLSGIVVQPGQYLFLTVHPHGTRFVAPAADAHYYDSTLVTLGLAFAVPEPAALPLGVLAGAGLVLRRRR